MCLRGFRNWHRRIDDTTLSNITLRYLGDVISVYGKWYFHRKIRTERTRQTKPDKKSTLIVKKRIYLLIQQACSLERSDLYTVQCISRGCDFAERIIYLIKEISEILYNRKMKANRLYCFLIIFKFVLMFM